MKLSLERILHRNMAIVGGFMAGYAIITRLDVMGNAQTMNLTQLVIALLGGSWFESLLRALVIVMYFVGGFLFVVCKHKCKHSVKLISIAINAAAMIIIGFMPAEVFPVVALYPVFFAMAYQWNAFATGDGYVSSTIFSTNNVRQISLSLGEYVFEKDKKHLKKAFFFFGSLVHFHVGVAYSYFATKFFGIHGAWLGLVILIPAVLFTCKERRTNMTAEQ